MIRRLPLTSEELALEVDINSALDWLVDAGRLDYQVGSTPHGERIRLTITCDGTPGARTVGQGLLEGILAAAQELADRRVYTVVPPLPAQPEPPAQPG